MCVNDAVYKQKMRLQSLSGIDHSRDSILHSSPLKYGHPWHMMAEKIDPLGLKALHSIQEMHCFCPDPFECI